MNEILNNQFEDDNPLKYWTRKFFLSCNRLKILLELDGSESILNLERILNRYSECKLQDARELSKIFNVNVGNIYDN